LVEKEKKEVKIKSKEDYFKIYPRQKIELAKDQYVEVDYPKPNWTYRLIYETFQNSIEEAYFWVLNYLRYDMGYPEVDKIIDVFAASEHSAFFGVAQQRIGLQQDKVSQFLATVGKMVKELFQLVRELRILDERLHYYKDSYTDSKSSESAEITLKGIWIDLVEGGSKNPASVYGMARELQFTTLPDLFFSTRVRKAEDVDEAVDKLDFNRKVKEVLKRKLRTFMEWKEHTFRELKTKRRFTLQYLRQHYDIIKMYMNWVKPYLRNIKRLQAEQYGKKAVETPDLISAFESSMVEIEILAKQIPQNNKEYKACILANFVYRTKPSMSYQQEGYQRGPIHVGETTITLRTYAWNDEDIENYKRMRELEDLELLMSIDSSLRSAMEALGEELENYLEEAGEMLKKKEVVEEEKPKKPTIFEPFGEVAKGFGELFGSFKPSKSKRPVKKDEFRAEQEKKAAIGVARGAMWNTYKNFKKAHRMITW
jgi:hypothetical protein